MLLLALLGGIATAQAIPQVPANLQAALFAKMFKYDKKFEGRQDPIRVVVVHEALTDEVRAITQAMTSVGMKVSQSTLAGLPAMMANTDVAYAMPEVSAELVGKACLKSGSLSVSGVAGDAEKGWVSVALGVKGDGRPQIIVNVTQAAREGHNFSSQLLALAKIVR
ncbi:MAG: YfiR/HmsC family protein [Pseudomonadota bacterium]